MHGTTKTCFISAPAGTDLSVLTTSLGHHGYTVIVPASLSAGQRWLDALADSLKRADLVVGVLGPGEGSNNVTFELGWAAGLGKRVLIIASPLAGDLPFAALSLLVVRAEATEEEAIDFALDNLPNSLSRHVSPSNKGVARTMSPDRIETYRQHLAAVRSEAELRTVLRDMLLDAGVDVVAEARFGGRRADFAIWSDELGAYLGNPLIIEVKHELSEFKDLAIALAQLTNYLHASGAPWGLLLYAKGPERALIESQASQASRVLVLSTEDLLDRLKTGSLFDAVRDLRNQKVHGVSRQ